MPLIQVTYLSSGSYSCSSLCNLKTSESLGIGKSASVRPVRPVRHSHSQTSHSQTTTLAVRYWLQCSTPPTLPVTRAITSSMYHPFFSDSCPTSSVEGDIFPYPVSVLKAAGWSACHPQHQIPPLQLLYQPGPADCGLLQWHHLDVRLVHAEDVLEAGTLLGHAHDECVLPLDGKAHHTTDCL